MSKIRTYQITLPDSYCYESLNVSEKEMKVVCKYSPDFKGYPCGTQGPPTKNVFVDRDETKILSATIIHPQLIVANVEYVPTILSSPAMQQISLLQL